MSNDYFESEILNNIRGENVKAALNQVKQSSFSYLDEVNERKVFPIEEALDALSQFDEKLSDNPVGTQEIIDQLDRYGSPATVAQTGGRYFGFVNGGILPAALSARWLSDVWDQNAVLQVISPIASKLEEVCEKWLIDLFHLPGSTAVGFVSGSSIATLCGLMAGRNHLLKQLGYDVNKKGLFHAPEIQVVLSEEAHSTVFKALGMIGLGGERVTKVPSDNEGRLIVSELPPIDERTLLILQAGNVNTGSFENFSEICTLAHRNGAWVHVDGAFGLWAAASDKLNHLIRGIWLADSWSADGHKTLNTPYDNGLILCKSPSALTEALHMIGSYIIYSEQRDGMLYTPEMSRRARAVELWAALKSLGSRGVAELVEELHDKARYFAYLLSKGGLEIVNEVVFNQVLVHYNHDLDTNALIEKVQQSGVCWVGGASWKGKRVMRVSVSSYKTTYEDIERSAEDMLRLTRME